MSGKREKQKRRALRATPWRISAAVSRDRQSDLFFSRICFWENFERNRTPQVDIAGGQGFKEKAEAQTYYLEKVAPIVVELRQIGSRQGFTRRTFRRELRRLSKRVLV